MKQEQQRIEIAKACGWAWHVSISAVGVINPATKTLEPNIPDYLNDLNAMREVEEKLNNSRDADLYMRELLRIVRGFKVELFGELRMNTWTIYALVHATAAQRAEAFLRTLNLWSD